MPQVLNYLGHFYMQKNRDFIVICDNLRSLYNIGSIFRTSDAAGVTKIYLVGICGTPPQKGIAKVALGAEQSVPWEQVKRPTTLLKKLKRQGVQIVALEQAPTSQDYRQFKPRWPLALIVGNEVSGVAKNLLAQVDTAIYLPQLGMKESLNVSVAFGIAAYYLRFNR
jgi:tRNA G18 (ribose-2'-O)-methylase SpoU